MSDCSENESWASSTKKGDTESHPEETIPAEAPPSPGRSPRKQTLSDSDENQMQVPSPKGESVIDKNGDASVGGCPEKKKQTSIQSLTQTQTKTMSSETEPVIKDGDERVDKIDNVGSSSLAPRKSSGTERKSSLVYLNSLMKMIIEETMKDQPNLSTEDTEDNYGTKPKDKDKRGRDDKESNDRDDDKSDSSCHQDVSLDTPILRLDSSPESVVSQPESVHPSGDEEDRRENKTFDVKSQDTRGTKTIDEDEGEERAEELNQTDPDPDLSPKQDGHNTLSSNGSPSDLKEAAENVDATNKPSPREMSDTNSEHEFTIAGRYLDERLVTKQESTGKLSGTPSPSVLRDVLLLSYKKASVSSATETDVKTATQPTETNASESQTNRKTDPEDCNNNKTYFESSEKTPLSKTSQLSPSTSVDSALASGSFRLYPPIFAEMKLFVEETKGKIVHDKLFNEITTDEQLSQRPGIQDIGNSVKSIADVYEILSKTNLTNEEAWVKTVDIIHTLADSLCDENWRKSLNIWHQALTVLQSSSTQGTSAASESGLFLVPAVTDDEDALKREGVLHAIPNMDITLVEKLFYLRHMDVHTRVHATLAKSVMTLDLCDGCIHGNPPVRERLCTLLNKIAIHFTMRYADEKLAKTSHLGNPFDMPDSLLEGVREATWQIYWQITSKYPCTCVQYPARKGRQRQKMNPGPITQPRMMMAPLRFVQQGQHSMIPDFTGAYYPGVNHQMGQYSNPGPNQYFTMVNPREMVQRPSVQRQRTNEAMYPLLTGMLNNQARAYAGLTHTVSRNGSMAGSPSPVSGQTYINQSGVQPQASHTLTTPSVSRMLEDRNYNYPAAKSDHRGEGTRAQSVNDKQAGNQPALSGGGKDLNNQIASAIERLEQNVRMEDWKTALLKNAVEQAGQQFVSSEMSLNISSASPAETSVFRKPTPVSIPRNDSNTDIGIQSGSGKEGQLLSEGSSGYQSPKTSLCESEGDGIFSPNFKPLDFRELKEMADLPQIVPKQTTQEAEEDPLDLFPLYRSLSYPSVRVRPTANLSNDMSLYNTKKAPLQNSNLLTASTASQTSILSEVSTVLSLDDVSSEDRYPVNLSMRAMSSNPDNQYQQHWQTSLLPTEEREFVQPEVPSRNTMAYENPTECGQDDYTANISQLAMPCMDDQVSGFDGSSAQPISLASQSLIRSSFATRHYDDAALAPHVRFSTAEIHSYHDEPLLDNYNRIAQPNHSESITWSDSIASEPFGQTNASDHRVSLRDQSLLQKTMQSAAGIPSAVAAPQFLRSTASPVHRGQTTRPILKRKSAEYSDPPISYYKRNRIGETNMATSFPMSTDSRLSTCGTQPMRDHTSCSNESQTDSGSALSGSLLNLQSGYYGLPSSDVLWDELRDRGFKVCDCGLVSKDRTLFYIHYGSHSHDGLFTCSFCGFVSGRGDACLSHLVDAHIGSM